MIHFYRLIYLVLKATLVTLAPLLGDKTKKWAWSRSAQFSSRFRDLQLKDSIWIHASSGEIEYAKALIRQLKQQAPQYPIVVTYSSESAEKLFENIKTEVHAFIPTPWDDRLSMAQFIRKIQPQILIVSRTDLWPEMIQQCFQRDIPMGLISYFPKLSFLGQLWLKPLLKKFSFVSCVDEETKTKVQALVKKSQLQLRVDGDTRFDQVFIRLDQKPKLEINSKNKIFTCGSTWPVDEEQLKPLWQEVLKNKQGLILSPHDVSEARIQELCFWLQTQQYNYKRLSRLTSQLNFDFQVLVIDQIGYLADAYRYSDFAFVGGSFKARVHSVMEPLACGLPVLVGPYYQNSPEALRYIQTDNGPWVHSGQNGEEILKKYKDLNLASTVDLKVKIKTEMQKNRGASKKIAELILHNFLKKSDS